MNAAHALLATPAGARAATPRVRVAGPIDGWRLLRELGRGRRSVVYLAQRTEGGGRVALKLGEAAGLAAEHALLHALSHPNVVRTEGHGIHAGWGWLAMEHAAGGPLSDRAGPLPPHRLASLLVQAAGALAALHATGWVHRDVKPANLLLRANGDVALADFGCACPVGSASAAPAGTVVGTPRYAAPEQGQGAPAAPAADVYSLGVLLFELLAGRPPFTGATLAEITARHLLAPVPWLPAAAARWQGVIDTMLAKDPGARPDAAQLALFRDPS